MTFLSTILSFFPAFVSLIITTSFLWLCFYPSIFSIAALFFSLYGFPLLIYKIHEYFFSIEEGITYLCDKDYSPWWGSHQIQLIYIAFPALETVLRLIPGIFSLWLRLWGAKIGKDIYWTPRLEIADRSLIEVGDRVVFGYGIGIYSHIIKPKQENLMLYVKKVKIGSNVFLGGGSQIGPGARVESGVFLPMNSHLYPNQVFACTSDKQIKDD